MPDGPNTLITYCYRDGGNWKFCGEFVVRGVIEREHIQEYLFDHEWFVPQKVGLTHLLTEPWDKEDHLLHELHEFERSEREDCLCSSTEFVERFKKARKLGWFDGFNGFDGFD
jgi:hypothetical protein